MKDVIIEQLESIRARLDWIETELRSLRADNLFMRARQPTRARVIAAGLSDADIDALIEEAREDVAHGRA